ncbi:MAG: hypothetical protein JNM17_20510 [Archangium sp.]|nr:hypothetical protein [Archangium sp.]
MKSTPVGSLVVASLAVVLAFSACPVTPGPDGGTGGGGGGGGGGMDAGYVNYLPEVFESAYGRAIAVHGGKLYVAGNGIREDAGTNNDFFVARFNFDFTRDTTFGTDGVAVAAYDGGVAGGGTLPLNNDTPMALTFDGDKIVLAGGARAFTAGTGDPALARFNADGTPDTTFGTSGLRLDDYGDTFPAMFTTVQVLPTGELFAAGGLSNGGGRNEDIILLKYTAAGAVDTSFSLTDAGAGAILDLGFGNAEQARGLFVQSSNNIVVGGGYGFPMARFLPGGGLDLAFGPNGTGVETNGNGEARKVLQRADGTFWLIGGIELNEDGGPGTERYFMKQVRVDANGAAITGFGNSGDGRLISRVNEWGSLRGAALQADGKLVIYYTYILQGRVTRLNVDGSVDTTFGTNGVKTVDIVLPLLEGGSGSGNQLTIDGNTAYITDINLVQATPSRTRQILGLVKVSL